MSVAPLTDSSHLATATFHKAQWFEQLQLWRPEAVDSLTTGEHETAVVLLSGTFDLMAGTTNWPARGARKTAFAGRAMAVFLPPNTAFRVGNEEQDGEILLISARQPAVDQAPVGKQVLSHKPLLPLAGSGKSFDPSTGEWKPAESFPTAAESLPPRRFERLAVGELTIDRIFAPSYKAATLSLDEVVIPAGASLCLGDLPAPPGSTERLLFVRPQSKARIASPAEDTVVDRDTVHLLSHEEANDVTVHSEAAPCYVVIAYAGKARD